jgi:stage II sporulation protein D
MKKVVFISAALTVFALILSVIVSLPGAPRADAPETETPESPPASDAPPARVEATSKPLLGLEDGATPVRVLRGETVFNLTMGEYLTGVVAGEMPVSFEPEALRAQAVAARTDALYSMLVSPNARHPRADMCDDPACCAAYLGEDALRERWGVDYAEHLAKIQDAVHATDGVYMTYASQPILAVFHSSSAGYTEDSGSVWRQSMPYLVSVPSPETPEEVPNYISTVTVSRRDFVDAVAAARPDAVFGGDASEWIADMTYSPGGRVASVTLGGVAVTGTELRAMFALRSTAVSVEITDADILFTTTGYGHGVGLSQYGANILARRGGAYREILSAYYTGVSFAGGDAASYLNKSSNLVQKVGFSAASGGGGGGAGASILSVRNTN